MSITQLPNRCGTQIHKTVARIRQLGARRVALQFPEGLLMYACVIADILEKYQSTVSGFRLARLHMLVVEPDHAPTKPCRGCEHTLSLSHFQETLRPKTLITLLGLPIVMRGCSTRW